MEPTQSPSSNRQTDIGPAFNIFKELGITNIFIVDDSSENLSAARSLSGIIESSGIKFDTFSSVSDFKTDFPSVNRSGHSLILTDLQMPSDEKFLGHENCGGIEVINSALLSESPGRINFPIVISHGGKGHNGEIVHLCFGNEQDQTSEFPLGKADPAFWQAALNLISTQLTTGEAKNLWDTRIVVNESNPFTTSILIEEHMKFGFIPFNLLSEWSR